MGEIKYAYYPRLLCLFGEVMHDAVPTLNLVLGVYVCATTKNIVFIPTPPLISLADFYASLLTAESSVRHRWQCVQLHKVCM